MISLCIAANYDQFAWFKILIKSIKSSLIDDIQITLNDYHSEQSHGKITIKGNELVIIPLTVAHLNIRHWSALSQSVENAKNDLVLLCDSDVFVHDGAIEYFAELLEKCDIVGVSHYLAIKESFGFYPNVIFTLLRKSVFDVPDYLNNESLFSNHYDMLTEERNAIRFHTFSPFLIKSKQHLYPHPNGFYETGSTLVPFIIENKLRWLSFQTTDIHNYSTQYWRSNFKLKLMKKKLIYHQSGSAGFVLTPQGFNQFDEFKEHYEAIHRISSEETTRVIS